MDCIFPKFTFYARSALKSWLWDFFTFCMRQLKIPRIWRRTLVVAIPKPDKPELPPYCVSPSKSSRDASALLSNQFYYRSITPAGTGGLSIRRSTVDQVTLLTQDIEDRSQLRRPISQQPTTLYGFAASNASYCDCYLTGTWSA